MKVHKGFEGTGIRNAVVTTGSFDGVHVGHKVIIKQLVERAKELGGESVLITFYPHPRKVLYPDSVGKDLLMISTYEEKIIALEDLGLDHLIMVNFTLDFSKTSSVDFIRKYLVAKLAVKHVIIGFNHHFGHNREGDLEYLLELGKFYKFSVEEIQEQDIQNESVSSTKIRKALQEGNIQRANAYLDHPYLLSGQVILDEALSDKVYSLIGIDEDKLLPPEGAYAVSRMHGGERVKTCIWITSDENDNLIVLFYSAEPELTTQQSMLSFQFHKRISTAGPLAEIDASKIAADLEFIGDLIY